MRRTLTMSGLVAAAGLAAAAAVAAEGLTIVSWGGAYQESQRKAFFEPYSKEFNVPITEEEYSGEIAKIRAMVEADDVTWDVVDVDTQTAQQGCDEGILEELDYSRILDKSKMVERGAMDCAVANIVYSTIFAYDTSKFPNGGPTKIGDLFDLEKFPGKRALQKGPFGNLEFALMADGVPAAEVYEVLETPEGVDRAFAKLDTIKSQVVWWEAGAQPPQLLADGEVTMTTAWNGRIFNAMRDEGKPFQIVWDGQLQDFDLWAIPKGSPKLDEAYKFINWSMQAENMAPQTKYISYGPTNVDAIPLIEADILEHLPTAPQNSANALVASAEYWGDNGEELRKRFNTWLAQ